MDWIEEEERPPTGLRQSFGHFYADAIEVDSVAQEYEIINRQQCDCGGVFEVKRQSLLTHQDSHYDLIETRCRVCRKPRDFLFNVSRLFEGRRA